MKPLSQTQSKCNKNTKIVEADKTNRNYTPATKISQQFSSARFETSLELSLLSSAKQGNYYPCNPIKQGQVQAHQAKNQKIKFIVENKQKALQNSGKILAQSVYQIYSAPLVKQPEKISMCEGCLLKFQNILEKLMEQISLVSLDYRILKEQINIQLRTYVAAMTDEFQRIVFAQSLVLQKELNSKKKEKDYEFIKFEEEPLKAVSEILKRQAKSNKVKQGLQFTSSRSEFDDNSPVSFQINAEFSDLLKSSKEHQLQTSQRLQKIKKTINGLKRKLTKSTSITY